MSATPKAKRRRLPPSQFLVSTLPASDCPALTPEQWRRGLDVLFAPPVNAPLFIANTPATASS